MLVTDEFVFVHVQKSGGEFLRRCIRETCDVRFEGVHTPYNELPPEFRGLPALTFKRNPWDWYVSLWHHGRRYDGLDKDFPVWLRTNFLYAPWDGYTRIFFHLVGRDGVRKRLVDVGRFETLREDFVAFLDHHGAGNEALRDAVLTRQPVNTSNGRGHYRDYYEDETRKLVGASRMARGYEF